MKQQYDLTIVTPSYNQGKYIAQTFDSLLHQKTQLFSLQYIIVDALSTDSTVAVVKKYLPKFKAKHIDVIFISEKDSGQSNAINKGLKMAKGEIVTYLNSDDYYQPNILHKVVSFFAGHPTIDWAYGGWNVVNEKGEVFKKFQHSNFTSFAFRSYGSNIGQPSCFWRKSLSESQGQINEELHLAMDFDLWLRFLKKSTPKIMPFVIANLRYYGGAKSAQFMTKHNSQAYQVAMRHAGKNVFIRTYATSRFILGWLAIKLQRNISQVIEQR